MNSGSLWNKFVWAFDKLFTWEVYAQPKAFYLLLSLPLLLLYLYWKAQKDKTIYRISSLESSEGNTPIKTLVFLYVPELILMFALVFFVFALARPQDAYSWEEEQAKGIDIVLTMDISTSMLARDFKPNRLEAAKSIATEFIKGRNTDRFGLVVFAGESFTQCPLTIDHERLVELFDGVKTGILEDGTAIGSGLATAIKRLKDSKAESKVLILLTDGENNAGDIAPEIAANLSQRFGIRIYTIGVGKNGMAEMPVARDFAGNLVFDKVEVKIDEKLLKQIASSSGGKYFRATGNKHLREIYAEIDQMEKTELASLKHSSKTELFLPHLLMGLILLSVSKILSLVGIKKHLIS